MNSTIIHPSHIAISARLTTWAADAEVRREWLAGCLLRHNEGRLLSAYQVPAWLTADAADPTGWVITDDLEDDEHTTTMLWPTDY